jgi:FkbM family methyltransferase
MKLVREYRNWKKRRKMIRFYREFVRPGDLCFDIGAHIGRYSEVYLALGAKVIAFEPQKRFAKIVQDKFRGKPVVVEACALGATPGEGTLYLSNFAEVATLSPLFIERFGQHYDHLEWGNTEIVPIRTLDEMIGKHGLPAFCKIDVEGSERKLFEGLTQRIPALSFEYTRPLQDEAIFCCGLLAALGRARFNFMAYENMQFRCDSWLDSESIKDYLHALPDGLLHGDVFVKI